VGFKAARFATSESIGKMTPREIMKKYNLSKIHSCNKSKNKLVNITIDYAGVTRCGYCNKVVNYLEYRTLEMDLLDCFTKRGIEVETIEVLASASRYIIGVKR